jgi:NTP pyrophosphatase (non-canonical NTP hydrolase)
MDAQMRCGGLKCVTVFDAGAGFSGSHSEPCRGCQDCAGLGITVERACSERDRAEGDTGVIRDEAVDTRAVMEFSLQMLKKIRKNAHKSHWGELSNQYLFFRMVEEVGELAEALMLADENPDAVVSECCDVAAFAMFISNNASCRRQPK